MKLIDFVNSQYSDFSNFDIDTLYDRYKTRTLYIPNVDFDNIDSFGNYEMKDGDLVTLYQCIEIYKENNTIHVNHLKDNVNNIYGLSDRVINNIKDELGEVFKVDDLKNNYKNISGLGKKTMDNIIEYEIKKD